MSSADSGDTTPGQGAFGQPDQGASSAGQPDPWPQAPAFEQPGPPGTVPPPAPGAWPQGQPTQPGGQFPGNQLPGNQFPGGQYPGGQYPGHQYQAGPPQGGQFPGQQPGQFPGQYPGDPYGYQPPFPMPVSARNNPLAIAALICGIGQFVLGLLLVGNILLAVPAIVLGAMGLRQISQRGEQGRGMAIAGLVLGILGVLYFLLVIVAIVVGVHIRHSS